MVNCMLCTSYHSNNIARTPRSACPPLPPTPGCGAGPPASLRAGPAGGSHGKSPCPLGTYPGFPPSWGTSPLSPWPPRCCSPSPIPSPTLPRASAGTVPSACSIPSAQVLPALQAPDHTALLGLWVQRCPSPGPPATRPLSQPHMLLTVCHNWGPEGQALWPGVSGPHCPGQGSFTYREGPGCWPAVGSCSL